MRGIDCIYVFCDPMTYNEKASSAHLEHSQTVLLCSSPSDNAIPLNAEPSFRVFIEDGYFLRYRSPYRGEGAPGAILPPMRAIEKLTLRLYDKNAQALYSALKSAAEKSYADSYSVVIYSKSSVGSGFIIDTAIMLRDIIAKMGADSHIRVCVDTENSFLPTEHAGVFTHTIIEELSAAASIDRVSTQTEICSGDMSFPITLPIIDEFCLFDNNGYLDIDSVYKSTPAPRSTGEEKFSYLREHHKLSERTGWPYFFECKWDHIDYADFRAEEETVEKIKQYAFADLDGGYHLYSPETLEMLL